MGKFLQWLLREMGLKRVKRRYHVNLRMAEYMESMALEAAIAGQGVALASAALVEGDLAAGRLVRPFPPSASQATAFSYYLVYPDAKADDPKVVAFRDWVLGDVAPVEDS